MAIFGSLKDITLLDLLPLLLRQDGRLFLMPERGGELSLYLVQGRVLCAERNTEPLPLYRLEEELFAIMNAEGVPFEFVPGATISTKCLRLNASVEELFLKLTALRDELARVKAPLPLPDTVFVLARVGELRDPALSDFLRRAREFLERGATPRQLSVLLEEPLDKVRYLLLKLRLLGLVRPLPRPKKAGNKGTAAKLLELFKRRFGLRVWNR